MCLAAAYWARVSRIVYANTREEAAAIGFDDAAIYQEIAQAAGRAAPADDPRPERGRARGLRRVGGEGGPDRLLSARSRAPALLPACHPPPQWPAAAEVRDRRAMLMHAPSLRAAALPDAVRAVGGVRLLIGRRRAAPPRCEIAERGGFRVRFPRAAGGACEGVLLNTGGGLTGGDSVTIEAALAPGAAATLTTAGAEKLYRSEGADTAVVVALRVDACSRLDWLPQETILFDGARLRRRLAVEMAADASLMLVETAVFGRAAMSERVHCGLFRDRWRIRRGGRLVFAEDVRLEGAIAAALARPAVANGGRAVATCLLVAPDAEARLAEARAGQERAAPSAAFPPMTACSLHASSRRTPRPCAPT